MTTIERGENHFTGREVLCDSCGDTEAMANSDLCETCAQPVRVTYRRYDALTGVARDCPNGAACVTWDAANARAALDECSNQSEWDFEFGIRVTFDWEPIVG